MSATHDCLLEIGCEELPPYSLSTSSQMLAQMIEQNLKKSGLTFQNITYFASPRRLAVRITSLPESQPMRIIERRGPPAHIAMDAQGQPLPAYFSFAKSCHASDDQLHIKDTSKGKFLTFKAEQVGLPTAKLLPDLIAQSIKQLPMVKPMRWGSGNIQFIRPIHWIVLMLDHQLIPCTLLGQKTSTYTVGHRFHAPQPVSIHHPRDYEHLLESKAWVIPSFQKRRNHIKQLIHQQSKHLGEPIIDEDLLDEVTGLTEWPTVYLGHFEPKFLDLPKEVLISMLKIHQRCFSMSGINGQLKTSFILVSNIESKDPKQVIAGNERVINARLYNADFFYRNDLKHPLADRLTKLSHIVFQRGLGSMADKAHRLSSLTKSIAITLNADADLASRAGLLSKCDLATEVVNECPMLQGIMGQYYAYHDQEKEGIAQAISDHYHPRFSGDTLPQSLLGVCVGLADRLDTLIGMIGINKMPSGDKDPFGLRRAAMSILRLLIEKALPLDLFELLQKAKDTYSFELPNLSVVSQTFEFIMGRLEHRYVEQGIPACVLMAVSAVFPTQPLDFEKRIAAVHLFQRLPESEILSAANKRVRQILKKHTADNIIEKVNPDLFEGLAEHKLYNTMKHIEKSTASLYQTQQYTKILQQLTQLADPVDHFFKHVMVITDNIEKRKNRLVLLAHLQRLFLGVADISCLS